MNDEWLRNKLQDITMFDDEGSLGAMVDFIRQYAHEREQAIINCQPIRKKKDELRDPTGLIQVGYNQAIADWITLIQDYKKRSGL